MPEIINYNQAWNAAEKKYRRDPQYKIFLQGALSELVDLSMSELLNYRHTHKLAETGIYSYSPNGLRGGNGTRILFTRETEAIRVQFVGMHKDMPKNG